MAGGIDSNEITAIGRGSGGSDSGAKTHRSQNAAAKRQVSEPGRIRCLNSLKLASMN